MIRWSYVLPRLAAVVGFLLLVHFGLPLLVRWSIIRSLGSTTGTAVAIDRVWTSPARGRVQLNGVRVARSGTSETNAIDVKSAVLAIDLRALMRREFIIDAAEFHGLEFGTRRAPSDDASRGPRLPHRMIGKLAEHFQDFSRRWMEAAAQHLARKVEEEFESVRLADELADRWPAKLAELEQEIASCREAAEQLRRSMAETPGLSLNAQQIAALQDRWREAQQLRAKVAHLSAQIQQLPRAASDDQVALQTALENDRARVLGKFQLVPLDGQLLNEYLLDSEYRRWWNRLQPWLETARWLTESPQLNTAEGRGAWIEFGKDQPGPRFLIRSAKLDGKVRMGDGELTFIGRARDVSRGGSPDACPTRLHLVTRGKVEASVDAEFDRAGELPRRRVAFRCREFPLPSHTWGQAGGWALAAAPTTANVQMTLTTTGNRLSGNLVLAQQGIQLTPSLPPDAGNSGIRQALADAVRDIHQMQVVFTVSGRRDAPDWEIKSDIGPALAVQFQRIFQRQLDRHAERLADQAQQRIDDRLQKIQELLATRQAEWSRQLGTSEQILSSLAQPVAARWQKPLGSLLRKF